MTHNVVVRISLRVCVHACLHMCVRAYVRTCMCTCLRKCVHMCVHMCVHTPIFSCDTSSRSALVTLCVTLVRFINLRLLKVTQGDQMGSMRLRGYETSWGWVKSGEVWWCWVARIGEAGWGLLGLGGISMGCDTLGEVGEVGWDWVRWSWVLLGEVQCH